MACLVGLHLPNVTKPPQKSFRATTIETEAIDDCAIFRQAEQARLGVSGLRSWRHRSTFNEAKPIRDQSAGSTAILVKPRRQSDWIRKFMLRQCVARRGESDFTAG